MYRWSLNDNLHSGRRHLVWCCGRKSLSKGYSIVEEIDHNVWCCLQRKWCRLMLISMKNKQTEKADSCLLGDGERIKYLHLRLLVLLLSLLILILLCVKGHSVWFGKPGVVFLNAVNRNLWEFEDIMKKLNLFRVLWKSKMFLPWVCPLLGEYLHLFQLYSKLFRFPEIRVEIHVI